MDNSSNSDRCDNQNESDSVGLLRAIPEVVFESNGSHHNENHHPVTVGTHDRHLSPSSSSDSLMDELFQVDISEVTTSNPSTSMHQGSQPTLKDDESCISPSTSSLLDADSVPGTASTSQPSGVAQQAVINDLAPLAPTSPMSNPHMQVMDRSGGYDPNRIPASAFAVSPNTPTDWSVASNDSLFSIHERNQSFSREYSFLSDEFGKPVESTRQGELLKPGEFLKPGELLMFSPSFPNPFMDYTPRKNMEMGNDFFPSGIVGETVVQQPTENERENEKPGSGVNWNSSDLSSHSTGSGTSGMSFAFPILTEGVKHGSSKGFNPELQSEDKTPTSPPMNTSSKPKKRRCCSFACTFCSSCSSYSCSSFSCCSCFSYTSCRRCFSCFESSWCSCCY